MCECTLCQCMDASMRTDGDLDVDLCGCCLVDCPDKHPYQQETEDE